MNSNTPLNNLDSVQWYNEAIAYLKLPVSLRKFFFHSASMTKFLRHQSKNHYVDVNVTGRYWRNIQRNETQLLGKVKAHCLVREVELSIDDNKVVMWARTIMPIMALSGSLKQLQHLKNKPLGDVIFQYPTLRRSPFEFGQVQCDEKFFWARRSVFHILRGQWILINEIFSDVL